MAPGSLVSGHRITHVPSPSQFIVRADAWNDDRMTRWMTNEEAEDWRTGFHHPGEAANCLFLDGSVRQMRPGMIREANLAVLNPTPAAPLRVFVE